MNFDLNSLEAATATTYRLVLGKDEKTGEEAGLVLLGPNSPEYRELDRKFQIARIQTANRKTGTIDLSTESGAATVVDKGAGEEDMLIAACTKDWFGFKIGDAPAPFSAENLARLMAARPTWRRRITRAIENEANFETA